MKLEQILLEFYSYEKDSVNKAEISDVRRPRLTLRKVSKMRQIRDMRRFEEKMRLKRLPYIYSTPDEGDMGF